MLVADARQAVKEEAPMDRLRSLTAELQQVYHGLLAARGVRAVAARAADGRAAGGAAGRWRSDDDVIDAEFDRD